MIKKQTYKIPLYISCLLMALLSSCRSHKEVLEKIETKKIDSVYISTKILEVPPILSSLIINQICDSVTGKAKEFKQTFVVGKDTSTVEIKNNELIINFNRLKQVLSQKDSIIKVRDYQLKQSKEKTVTKYRTNWKLVLFLIAIPIIFIVFPVVPNAIRKIIKLA